MVFCFNFSLLLPRAVDGIFGLRNSQNEMSYEMFSIDYEADSI